MPATDSPAVIVARFLQANNYSVTLDAFVKEAGLHPAVGVTNKGDLTIEQVLEEKKTFDISVRFEKFGVAERDEAWSLPAPSRPKVVDSLPTSSNLLHVNVCKPRPSVLEKHNSLSSKQILSATTADRRLSLLYPTQEFSLIKSHVSLQDSPILQVVLYDHAKDKILDERRDYNKYVVKGVSHEDSKGAWVATAGWDSKVFLYRLTKTDDEDYKSLGPPVSSLAPLSNPEALLFLSYPETDALFLLVTRRDSTIFYYYGVPHVENLEMLTSRASTIALPLLGTQDLAPHANAWVAFSPSSISICPKDPNLLAIATSALPDMKLIIVRMLLPLHRSSSEVSTVPATAASQARAALATKDREEAAILVHSSTGAPQTS
ncbi:MAG: hypothetical protein MMC33_002477 [Icmadophila ericetorum]|nr:hypothetical protein [Icmadophila ericetorum]